MKKIILTVSIGCAGVLMGLAQNDIDAMRYSQLTFGGTARFTSMAGSMGALGGDMSTLSINPAGIGVFRKSELQFTPALFTQTTSSTFNGMSGTDRKFNLNISNIGFIGTFHMSDKNTSGWETVSIGIVFNKTNNFNNRVSIGGYNTSGSLLDTYVDAAKGNDPSKFDGFSTNLAYQAYLINPIAGDTLNYNHVIPRYGELQKKAVDMSGKMGETDISFGGNYKSKFYIGGSVGIAKLKYTEESSYEEVDNQDSIPNFKSFKFAQKVSTAGWGLNVKVGVIVKPTDWLRIGAAVHSPTQFTMADDYSDSMSSDLDSSRTYTATSPQGHYDYSLTTPFRAIGSLGFIINKIALLNVDYEYLDYTNAQLSSKDPGTFGDVNTGIRNKYTQAGNLRVGGEVRFDPLAFRLGYALYGSPFKDGDNKSASRASYTGGIGYRHDNYFFDFAYVLTMYSDYSYLYNSSTLSPVKNNYRSSAFIISAGVRF